MSVLRTEKKNLRNVEGVVYGQPPDLVRGL